MTETAAAVIVMADTIHIAVRSIPAGAQKVAGYVTGSSDVRWTAEDWARFNGVKVGINQMAGSDPLLGDVFDVEPGAWSIKEAAQASRERQAHGLEVSLYTSQSLATPLVKACFAVGVTSGNLWVANWNLSQAEATAIVMHRHQPWPVQAVQWAQGSDPNALIPSSDPMLATYNLSVTAPSWPTGAA